MRFLKRPKWFYCWVSVSCLQAEVPFHGERFGLFTIPEFRSRLGKEIPTLQVWFPEHDDLYMQALQSEDVSPLRCMQIGSVDDGVQWSVSPLDRVEQQIAETLPEFSGFLREGDVHIPITGVPDALARVV